MWCKLVGQIPASFRLAAGRHEMVLQQPGQADCVKQLMVLAQSQTTVTADCFPPQRND